MLISRDEARAADHVNICLLLSQRNQELLGKPDENLKNTIFNKIRNLRWLR